MREAVELAPDSPIAFVQLARLEARSGAQDAALAALERAVDLGFRDQGYLAWERSFEPLRANAAFADLAARSRALPAPASTAAEIARSPGNVCALSPDGSRMVVDGGSGTLPAYLLDAATGELVSMLPEGAAWGATPRFDPDSTHLLTSDEQNGIVLWDAFDGHLVKRFDPAARARSGFQFDAEGTLVTCETEDGLRL